MNIYWDTQNRIFVSSLSNSAQISSLEFVLGDQVYIDLYPIAPDATTGAYVYAAAPEGFAPKCGIRKTRKSADLLVFASTWTWDETNKKYSGLLNLESTELAAALGEEEEDDFVLEMAYEDISTNKRYSTQLSLRIWYNVLRGDESELAATPPYPWIEEFTDPVSGELCMRFKNSQGKTMLILTPEGV